MHILLYIGEFPFVYLHVHLYMRITGERYIAFFGGIHASECISVQRVGDFFCCVRRACVVARATARTRSSFPKTFNMPRYETDSAEWELRDCRPCVRPCERPSVRRVGFRSITRKVYGICQWELTTGLHVSKYRCSSNMMPLTHFSRSHGVILFATHILQLLSRYDTNWFVVWGT